MGLLDSINGISQPEVRMKKFIFTFLLVVAGTTMAQQKYAPHVDQLNVRNAPSTQNSTVVDTLSQGTTVVVYAQKKDEQNRVWFQIKQGWIASWLVSPVTTISGRGIETNEDSPAIEDTSDQADEPVWGEDHAYESLDTDNSMPEATDQDLLEENTNDMPLTDDDVSAPDPNMDQDIENESWLEENQQLPEENLEDIDPNANSMEDAEIDIDSTTNF